MTRARFVFALALAVCAAFPALAHAQDLSFGTNCKRYQQSQIVPMDPQQLDRKTPDGKAVYHITLIKDVWFTCDGLQVYADRVEGDTDSDWANLTGNITIMQGDVRFTAMRAEFNRRTHLGKFYDVIGVFGVKDPGAVKTPLGGGESEMLFTAELVEKIGAETYRMTNASATACQQPTPRWTISGSGMTFVAHKHVTMRNAVFRVKDVPLLYLPYFYYPINKEDRSTGFLMPSYGTSTQGGFTLNNAFFWAINPSQDATLFHTYFKKSGQAFGGEYRYVTSPGSEGHANFTMLDVIPVGSDPNTAARTREYTLDVTANQLLPHNFQLQASVHHFTNATTQQIYEQNIIEQTRVNRSISANLSGYIRRFRTYANYQRIESLSGTTFATRSGYGPKAGIQIPDIRIKGSDVRVGVSSAEVAYLLRHDNLADPSTNHNMWRVDTSPVVRAALKMPRYMLADTNATFRFTQWLDSQDSATGQQLDQPISRFLFTAGANVTGPSIERVWQPHGGYADRVKHRIDPVVNYGWNSPFTRRANLVRFDGVEDPVGGTSSLTYGVRNTVSVQSKAAPGQWRAILTAEVKQTYYTDALAASADTQYQTVVGLPPPANYSPIDIQINVMPVVGFTANFRTDIDPKFHKPRTLNANGGFGGRNGRVNFGWSKRQVITGLEGFSDPAFASHFLTGNVSLRRSSGHFGGTYDFHLDVKSGKWRQQRIMAYYNSQCCGLTIEYMQRDFNQFNTNFRPQRTFGFTFSLAGLGSFTNPFGSFGQ